MENSEKRKHYKTITINNREYDLRSVVQKDGENVTIQNYENVQFRFTPVLDELKNYLGRTTVIMTLPFNPTLSTSNKQVFNSNSVTKQALINECITKLKLMNSYRTPSQLEKIRAKRTANSPLTNHVFPRTRKKVA